MPTVFDAVVTKENHHTDLFRNLMERDGKTAALILTGLTGVCLSEQETQTFRYQTQCSFVGPDGRAIPDLLITGRNFQCIVEVKVDAALGLTPKQLSGYVDCYQHDGDKFLCFLVPHAWGHFSDIDQVRVSLEKSDIKTSVSYWPQLVNLLGAARAGSNDQILHEIYSFWKWQFEVNIMEPEERGGLTPWSPNTYSAFRKLEKTVDQTRDLFHARGYETERETYDVDGYSFYLKRGRLYLLWIGIWTAAPTPLSFGYRLHNREWQEPTHPGAGGVIVKGYYLWPLNPESWTDPMGIFERVSFMQNQLWPSLPAS